MTRYERGFLNKCARVWNSSADNDSWTIGGGGENRGYFGYTGLNTGESSLAGAGIGAAIGALLKAKNRKDRARKAVIGALIGLTGGYGVGRLNEFGENSSRDHTVTLRNDQYNPIFGNNSDITVRLTAPRFGYWSGENPMPQITVNHNNK